MAKTTNKDVQTIHCIKCGKDKKETEFYLSTNRELFAGNGGRTHICKLCLKSFCYVNNQFQTDRFKSMLRVFDMPYIDSVIISSIEDKNETIGTYFKNIMLNYKDTYWTDVTSNNEEFSNGDDDFELTQDMYFKWGRLPKDDIKFLTNQYYEWVARHQCESRAEEVIFEEICQMQLEIKKTRESGGDAVKKVEALQKLMTSANIRPLDQSAMNVNENMMLWGTTVMTIEQNEPCEYFEEEKRKEYKDYKGYRSYFTNWILRPLKNLLASHKDYHIIPDEEFEELKNIEEESNG